MAYGLTSLKHAAQNIGGALTVGFKAGIGDFSDIGKVMPLHIASLGGALTFGGGLTAGTAIGALAGSSANEGSSAEGAVIGAVIGGASLPLLGFAAAMNYRAVSNIDRIGDVAMRGASKIGAASIQVGTGLWNSLNETSRFKNPVGNLTNKSKQAFESLIDFEPTRRNWNPSSRQIIRSANRLKLSGWGKMAVGMTAASSGMYGAVNAAEISRSGTMNEQIITATPRIPSYLNNGGADGDLVFALNANRRG